jgi:hypothetical protein
MAVQRHFSMPKVYVQQQVGSIVIKHSQLDHVYRLAIKRMLDISIDHPLYVVLTKRKMTKDLRRLAETLIKANTNERLTNGERVEVLQLLKDAVAHTELRNNLVHCTWGRKEGPGEPTELVDDGKKKSMPIPPLADLKKAATEIDRIRSRLNVLTKKAAKRII